MSERKHTEGQLKLCEVGDKCKHLCPATLDDVSILTVAIEYGDDGEPTYYGAVYNPEDARRIKAMWNACQSFTTDALEYGLPEKHAEAELMWERLMMQLVGEDGQKSVADAVNSLKLQRDTAWQELREIRETIKADENESTADEVRSLVKKYDDIRLNLDTQIHERCKAEMERDKLQKIVDEKLTLKRIDNLYESLSALEIIATAVVGEPDNDPLDCDLDDLRVELIRARKALGILPEQDQEKEATHVD